MKRFLPTLLLTSLLAGCFGSAPPLPRDHYYRLLVEAPAQTQSGAPLPGILTVQLLQADGLLRERPLLYSESGKSHEVQQHDYHYWNDTPPRMLQDQMITYLRQSGIAGAVVTPDMSTRPDYQVSGKARRLERLLGGGPPRVVVEVELSLRRLSDETLAVVDSYSEEEAAADNSIEASVEAMNRATARIFHRFLTQAIAAAGQLPDPQQAGRSN